MGGGIREVGVETNGNTVIQMNVIKDIPTEDIIAGARKEVKLLKRLAWVGIIVCGFASLFCGGVGLHSLITGHMWEGVMNCVLATINAFLAKRNMSHLKDAKARGCLVDSLDRKLQEQNDESRNG